MNSKVLFIAITTALISTPVISMAHSIHSSSNDTSQNTSSVQHTKYTKYSNNLFISTSDKDSTKDSTEGLKGLKNNVSKTYVKYQSHKKGVKQIGQKSSSIPLAGWGKEMPMPIALRQIVPPNFEIQRKGVSDSNFDKIMVSWKGNHPWPQVLDRLAESYDFLAEINWINRTVTIYPVVHKSEYKVLASSKKSEKEKNLTVEKSVSSLPKAETDKHKTKVTVTKVEPKPKLKNNPYFVKKDTTFKAAQHPIKKAPPPVAMWTLDPKLTLRENVEKWAKKAGWTVVWTGADYPIVASAKFTGKFDAPDGPLAKLIEAFSHSDQPLMARLTTKDKVVYVKNKYHQRVQVSPTYPSDIDDNM